MIGNVKDKIMLPVTKDFASTCSNPPETVLLMLMPCSEPKGSILVLKVRKSQKKYCLRWLIKGEALINGKS